MKKFLPILFILFSAAQSFATTWTITNNGSTFTPDSITITQGDTVLFNLQGTHNAEEVSQATWDVNGNTSNGGFNTPFGGGIVTGLSVGTYYYVCANHFSSGMKGRILVQAAAQPSVEFVITSSSESEGVGSFGIAVSITNPNSNPTSVDINVAGGGTATFGNDFTFSPLTVTFPANSTFTQNVTINIADDIIAEGNESFTFQLNFPTNGATIGTNAQHAVTIIDNDTLRFNISPPSQSVMEDAGIITFPVSLSNVSNDTTRVTIHLETIGTTATQGSDFYFNDTTLVWPTGSFGNILVPVTVFDDNFYEPNETVKLQLINPTNGATLLNDTFQLTIQNNDSIPPAFIHFISSGNAIREDTGTVDVIIQIDNPSTVPVDFFVARDDNAGTASPGADFNFGNQHYITNSGGTTYDTIHIAILEDQLVEPTETVVLHFVNVLGNLVVVQDSVFTLSITDNDTLTASYLGAGFSYVERDTLVAVKVFLSTFPTDTVWVNVTLAPGNTTYGEDFIFNDTVLVFLPNSTDTQSAWIRILDDNIVEQNEQINFDLRDTVRGTRLGISAYTLTIIDNDSTVGISQVDWDNGINIFPNPVSNSLYIETKNDLLNVEINDLLGNTIIRFEKFSAGRNAIEVSSLCAGIYFLNVRDKEKMLSKRFIKQQ